jgi:cell division protein FtsI/penicillin-binding protein 2
MISRVGLLRGALIAAVGVVGVRLFVVQIVQHAEWVARADAEHIKQLTIPAKRGKIYMLDDGKPVAVVMNEPVWTVFVDPKMVKKEEEVERVVAEAAGTKVVVPEWGKVWEDKERRYYIVAKNVSRSEAAAIKAAGLSGVGMSETVRRVYPEEGLAAQVLGFVNNDGMGQYGVEGFLNKKLSGENGFLKTVTDVNNVPLTIGSDNVRVAAVDGEDIVLTIDRNVQRAAEKIIKAQVEKLDGDYASMLVMNPNNGEVVAMANYPSFEPAEYWKVGDASVYMNPITMAPYEPASVCKTFTFATGIDVGVMSPSTRYRNTGSTVVGDRTVHNAESWRELGDITMQTAFDRSLNTGSIEALRLLDGGKITRKGEERMYDYFYNKFGLGRTTGVEVAGEVAGIVHSPESLQGRGAEVQYANMTFGQGLTTTMIEIAAGFSAVVNGGEYYQPTIVAGKMSEVGELVRSAQVGAKWWAVSAATSEAMRQMLVGTRWFENDPAGYVIGGKTGTAETYDKNGKPTMNTTIGSYVGFIGRELPEYVIMVRIGGEGKNMHGYAEAEPMFNEMKDYLIEYLRMGPKD